MSVAEGDAMGGMGYGVSLYVQCEQYRKIVSRPSHSRRDNELSDVSKTLCFNCAACDCFRATRTGILSRASG